MLVGGKNRGSDACLEQADTGHSYADSDQSTKQGHVHTFGSYHSDDWQP